MVERRNGVVTSPAEVFGFEPGDDRKLASWAQISGYFESLAAASERVAVEELGRTTNGNRFILALISAPETLRRLDEVRDGLARLYDPRRTSEAEARDLIASLPAPVLITSSIHATEVGPAQSSVLIAQRLAESEDEDIRRVLDQVLFLYVPCLNPDGLEIVRTWYERTLGTPYEGQPPPELYHKYTGHDNNRDWFMFTQAETRMAIGQVHNVWHPVVVYDQHQMGRESVRMMVPPFMDPYDPTMDPILVSEIASTGLAMATELAASGHRGVTVNAIYDAFSPSRQYQHYHGGLRILSEIASVKIATPVEVGANELREGRGVDPRTATWAHPLPWRGGAWRLRDIVAYNYAATFALLDHVARYRDRFLRNQRRWAEHSLTLGEGPRAYLVPPDQRDPGAAAEMLETLRFGDVELLRATREIEADGVRYPAETVVVPLDQPVSSFARTMLGALPYPDMRQYPGGPPKPPYDVTAHSLPLLFGVRCVPVRDVEREGLEALTAVAPPRGAVHDGEGAAAFLLAPAENASVKAVNALLAGGATVRRLSAPARLGGVEAAAGSYLTSGIDARLATQIAEEHHVTLRGLRADASPAPAATLALRTPRLGLYQSWMPNMDEGWTRFIFEAYGFAYTTLHDADMRQGGLSERFDSILLPAQSAEGIQNGNRAGEYPPEYCGGVGLAGAAALREFVNAGGTLIALDHACDWAIEQLALPVQDVLRGVSQQDFYAPGTLLRIVLDTEHPVAWGLPREVTGMFLSSPAFDVKDGTVVGRYPWNAPLAAGWLRGGERIQGRAAIVEQRIGAGQVILLGFRVQFRAQMRGTYRLLFNSIYYGSSS